MTDLPLFDTRNLVTTLYRCQIKAAGGDYILATLMTDMDFWQSVAEKTGRESWPMSQEKWADKFMVERNVIKRRISTIKEMGLLQVETKGLPRRNHYRFDRSAYMNLLLDLGEER